MDPEKEIIGYDEDNEPVYRYLDFTAREHLNKLHEEESHQRSWWRSFWRQFGYYQDDYANFENAIRTCSQWHEHGRVTDGMRQKLAESLLRAERLL